MEGMGVEFVLNTASVRTFRFQTLLEEHDAVFLGMGTYSRQGRLPGEDLPGLRGAAYPSPTSIASWDREVAGGIHRHMRGKRTGVGGGDTGMDCNRTALRQGVNQSRAPIGADERTCAGSRRDFQNSAREVEFLFSVQPIEIAGTDRVEGVKLIETRLAPGPKGRRIPEPVPGRAVAPADAVVIAFGSIRTTRVFGCVRHRSARQRSRRVSAITAGRFRPRTPRSSPEATWFVARTWW
jgi:glutamate synthase (NADPH/NADH) small chain